MRQKIENLRNKYKGLSFSISNDKFMSNDDYMTNVEKLKCEARIEVLDEVIDLLEESLTKARINEGYKIIDSVFIGESEIVLAVNKINMYVTWEYFNKSYIWGHYFDDEKSARIDFYARIINKLK